MKASAHAWAVNRHCKHVNWLLWQRSHPGGHCSEKKKRKKKKAKPRCLLLLTSSRFFLNDTPRIWEAEKFYCRHPSISDASDLWISRHIKNLSGRLFCVDNKKMNTHTQTHTLTRTNTKSEAPFHLGSPSPPVVSNIDQAPPVSSSFYNILFSTNKLECALHRYRGQEVGSDCWEFWGLIFY